MFGLLRGAWQYRHFILSSIYGEFRARFARSRLGGLWLVINPLVQVLIFAFILSGVMAARLPGITNRYSYAIYLMAGTLCWSLFAEIIQRCLTLFIDNANLLKKMLFPRICLPLIATGGSMVANLLLFVVITAVFACLGHFPGSALFALPFVVALTIALALGVGLTMGVLNVFIRDLGQVVPVLLQLSFWLTPIVYLPKIVPTQYRKWLALNPLYPLIEAYHEILVYGRAPALSPLLPVILCSVVMLALALHLFRRSSAEMVDLL